VRNGALTDVFINSVYDRSFDPSTGGQIQIDLLGGTNTLTIDYSNGNPLPSGGLDFIGAGDNILNAIGSASGPNTLNLTATSAPLAGLNITGGLVTLGANPITAGTLSITGAGKLDLGTTSLALSSAGSLRQYLAAGYNGGAWNGATGLFSSWAAAQAGRMIGYIGTAQGLLVKPTLAGDTNLDLTVNSIDFNTLYANFGLANATWEQGDTNYSGKVDFNDFQAQERTFGQTVALPAPPVVIPAKLATSTKPVTPVKPAIIAAKKPVAKIVTKPTPVKPVTVAKTTKVFATTRIKK
jgi:hypothetical protein